MAYELPFAKAFYRPPLKHEARPLFALSRFPSTSDLAAEASLEADDDATGRNPAKSCAAARQVSSL